MKADLLALFGIEGCEVVRRRHPCHHSGARAFGS